jgi:carbon-monoxide dehydrogenase catalytic subunit
MSEKAIAISCYFVASGVDVILGHPFHISGSEKVTRFLEHDTTKLFGAAFHVCEEPDEAAVKIVQLMDKARKRLGIDKKLERKLFDMKDRRELNV